MRFLSLLSSSLLASGVVAKELRPQKIYEKRAEQQLGRLQKRVGTPGHPGYGGPASTNSTKIPQNANTTKFAVDGSSLPYVSWDVGESYAGLLPISAQANSSELYFWFFPSDNPSADDEILIWLNGGPGCSSLEGFLQENGPFEWQYGTYRPVQNPYTWVNLTNVVWVEQPAGTGFSQPNDTPLATSEEEVAAQFLGFWKNFIDTFGLQGRKIYITGESYAGYYVPYIADAMHNETDTTYYNAQGVLFYDPVLTLTAVQDVIPAVPMVDHWSNLFNLNDTFMEHLHTRFQACGYEEFFNTAMTFPPSGKLPHPPSHSGGGCNLWEQIIAAASLVNPCWDIYDIATTCPNLWDVLGFPGSFFYEPAPWNYFNRKSSVPSTTHPRQPRPH